MNVIIMRRKKFIRLAAGFISPDVACDSKLVYHETCLTPHVNIFSKVELIIFNLQILSGVYFHRAKGELMGKSGPVYMRDFIEWSTSPHVSSSQKEIIYY